MPLPQAAPLDTPPTTADSLCSELKHLRVSTHRQQGTGPKKRPGFRVRCFCFQILSLSPVCCVTLGKRLSHSASNSSPLNQARKPLSTAPGAKQA